VPASGDYDDREIGGMIGRQTEDSEKTCTSAALSNHKHHMLTGREHGPPLWEASD
jgi:hypothetical protein